MPDALARVRALVCSLPAEDAAALTTVLDKAQSDRYERQMLRDALIDLLSVLGGDTLEVRESHPGQWRSAVAQAGVLVENTNDEPMHSTACAGGCRARQAWFVGEDQAQALAVWGWRVDAETGRMRCPACVSEGE